jgi:rod shape-determining protein MreD
VGAVHVTARDATRVVLVVLLFITVQETLILDLRIGGVHPDIMLLLPIAAGIVGGPARGATMGFGAGLVADLFLPTPFGLSALVGSLIGFGVGAATVALDRSAFWLAPVAALGASALYEGLYAVLGSVLGQPQMIHADLFRIIVVVSVTNLILAVPALRLVKWALPAASIEGVPTSTVSTGSLR